MSDIEQLATDTVAGQESGHEVEILHPVTSHPVGIYITLAGPDSQRAIKARARATNQALQARRVKQLTAEEMEERAQRQLADIIISWRGVELGGRELEFSVSNALLVFGKLPWLQEQLEKAAFDRAIFT